MGSARPRKGSTSRFAPSDPLADLEEAEELHRSLRNRDDRTNDARSERDLEDLRRQAEEQTAGASIRALHGVACSLGAELDLSALVRRILQAGAQVLGAERGVLFLGGQGETPLVPALAVGVDGEELTGIERVSRTILRLAQLGEAVISPNAMADTQLEEITSVQVHRIRSVICVPLLFESETIGVLYLDSPDAAGVFPAQATRLAQAFAGIAAVALHNARIHGELLSARDRLLHQASASGGESLVGVSRAVRRLREQAVLAARLGAAVHVCGEPGTEAEAFARAVADARAAPAGPVALHCPAVPRGYAMELLFGRCDRHASGSSTGGRGLLLQADGGVLLLGAITALELSVQGKLERVLQRGGLRPVGGGRRRPVEVQLIVSATRPLDEDLSAGRLHPRLAARLGDFQVSIPPLRDRPEDIPSWLVLFARKHAWLRHDGRPVTFTREALAYLQGLPWAANAAEVEAFIRHASVAPGGSRIDLSRARETVGRLQAPIAPVHSSPPGPAPGLCMGVRPLREVEREAIEQALAYTKGNQTNAAKLLGVPRNTLLRKLDRWGIRPAGPAAASRRRHHQGGRPARG